jgi:hypothetical protein
MESAEIQDALVFARRVIRKLREVEYTFDGYFVKTHSPSSVFVIVVFVYVGVGLLILLAFFLRDYCQSRKQADTPLEKQAIEPLVSGESNSKNRKQNLQGLPDETEEPSPDGTVNEDPLYIPSRVPQQDQNRNNTNQLNDNAKGSQSQIDSQTQQRLGKHPVQGLLPQRKDESLSHHESQIHDRASAVPSVTTSSRAKSAIGSSVSQRSRRKALANGTNALNWKGRRSIGRIESMRRHVQAERQQHVSEEESASQSRSRNSRSSRLSRPASRAPSNRGMSELASNILREERIEGEAEFYRQKYISRHQRGRRAPSVADSAVSALPPLPTNALSPEDAADAHDIGQAPVYEDYYASTDCCGRNSLFSPLGAILDIAEFDFETRRILSIAIPSTVSSIAEPLYRVVVLGVVAYLISTASAVAYVLSIILLRLCIEPVSGAIADAQFAMLQKSLSEGGETGFSICGRLIQSALATQAIICTLICVLWAFYMDSVVLGLVSVEEIANDASRYTQIIVIDFIAQAMCRSFMLIFQVTDQGYLETNVDLFGSIASLVIVPIVIAASKNPDIVMLAWAQVGLGLARILVKILLVSMRGWMTPYKHSLFNCATVLVSVTQ